MIPCRNRVAENCNAEVALKDAVKALGTVVSHSQPHSELKSVIHTVQRF